MAELKGEINFQADKLSELEKIPKGPSKIMLDFLPRQDVAKLAAVSKEMEYKIERDTDPIEIDVAGAKISINRTLFGALNAKGYIKKEGKNHRLIREEGEDKKASLVKFCEKIYVDALKDPRFAFLITKNNAFHQIIKNNISLDWHHRELLPMNARGIWQGILSAVICFFEALVLNIFLLVVHTIKAAVLYCLFWYSQILEDLCMSITGGVMSLFVAPWSAAKEAYYHGFDLKGTLKNVFVAIRGNWADSENREIYSYMLSGLTLEDHATLYQEQHPGMTVHHTPQPSEPEFVMRQREEKQKGGVGSEYSSSIELPCMPNRQEGYDSALLGLSIENR